MERNTLYANALLAVLEAEGSVDESSDELFRFARVLEGNDQLWQALGDPRLPAERRIQIVQDVLDGKASEPTIAVISLLVQTGRSREIPSIVDQLVSASAAASRREVAEVRSAVELTDEQRERLAAALSTAIGADVEVKVVIDPSVMGGVLAQIGDRVFDGTVRSRLNQLRESF
jgi:F-type H+-transporting ATPase subunit delta